MSDFAEDCRQYLKCHARHAKLKAKMEVLRERILPELQAGKKSPRDLPFILVLQKRFRVLADWKRTFTEHLARCCGSEAVAEERIKEMELLFPTKEEDALRVEINKSAQAGL